MKLLMICLLFVSTTALAQTNNFEISARLGSPSCSSNVLFKEYVLTQDGLRKLRESNGSKDAIERHELALTALIPGLENSARVFGMTVVATFQSTPTPKIPTIEINKKIYPFAAASLNGNQVRLEFSELGICTFANSNGIVNDEEIGRAVKAMVVN